jgi:hypothetical protein
MVTCNNFEFTHLDFNCAIRKKNLEVIKLLYSKSGRKMFDEYTFYLQDVRVI